MSEMDGDGGSKIETSASSSDVTPTAKEAGEGVPAVPAGQPVTPANDSVPQQGIENTGQSGAELPAAPVEPGEGTPPVDKTRNTSSGSSSENSGNSSESDTDKAIREAGEAIKRNGGTTGGGSFYNGEIVPPSEGGAKPAGGGHSIERDLPPRR
jgi:hypothetical protein